MEEYFLWLSFYHFGNVVFRNNYFSKGNFFMQQINLIEKNVSTGLFQFIFSFSLVEGSKQNFITFFENQEFQAFQLNQLENENAFYGNFRVSHRDMEKYFFPNTNNILFPQASENTGFQRYSKSLNLKAILTNNHITIPFRLHSIDLTICPFELGFITLRTEISDLLFSQAIEYASSFQSIKEAEIELLGEVYPRINDFIFEALLPGLMSFLDMKSLRGVFFQEEPFAGNEQIYVQSLLSFNENQQIELADVYRSGFLNGLDADSKPFINSKNLKYIQQYVQGNSDDCWAPNRYYFFGTSCFTCISNESKMTTDQLASQFYGEFYYSLLVNLYHKSVFLKIARDYSKLKIDTDSKEIRKLIYLINSFTSNYFYLSDFGLTREQKLYDLFRKTFNIDLLYNNTKETLITLVKYDENTVTKKDSIILLILTLYTVVCGIFSMNLFTNDLKGKIHWSHLKDYNPFENFAIFIVFSGLLVATILLILNLFQSYSNWKNRKKWVKQIVFSSKISKK